MTEQRIYESRKRWEKAGEEIRIRKEEKIMWVALKQKETLCERCKRKEDVEGKRTKTRR